MNKKKIFHTHHTIAHQRSVFLSTRTCPDGPFLSLHAHALSRGIQLGVQGKGYKGQGHTPNT